MCIFVIVVSVNVHWNDFAINELRVSSGYCSFAENKNMLYCHCQLLHVVSQFRASFSLFHQRQQTAITLR